MLHYCDCKHRQLGEERPTCCGSNSITSVTKSLRCNTAQRWSEFGIAKVIADLQEGQWKSVLLNACSCQDFWAIRQQLPVDLGGPEREGRSVFPVKL